MPTALTHALAGLGVGVLLAPESAPWSYYALTVGLGLLPDLDVVAFSLGIPYGARFGHRGFSHSLLFALLASLLVAAAVCAPLGVPWRRLWGCFFAALVSHTLLDALTDGGMGVALFSPLDDRRYFFPWRPIRVSPIGRAAFSRRGLQALTSEVFWVWIPLGLAVGLAALLRSLPHGPESGL
jgi:inner membrane protein